MASKKADWSILRGPLIVFVVCVLAAAAMLSASYYFKQRMQREYQVNHNQFRSASQQYLAVDEEERIIEDFYPEFVRLHRRGLLGEERRLSWLETLRDAGQRIKIPELSYQLDPQAVTEPDPFVTLGGFELLVSPMKLSMGLLHEGDLMRLLQALDREALGQYRVRECAFKPAGNTIDYGTVASNLRAECTLEWLTLDLPGEEGLSL